MVGAPLRVARRSGLGGDLPEVVDDDGSITRPWLNDVSLSYGQAEVTDCFHRYRAPKWLARHFALRWSGLGGELPEVVDDDGSITRSWLNDLSLAYGQPEVKDCFHRYRVPKWLARHFALPAGLAWVGNFPKL